MYFDSLHNFICPSSPQTRSRCPPQMYNIVFNIYCVCMVENQFYSLLFILIFYSFLLTFFINSDIILGTLMDSIYYNQYYTKLQQKIYLLIYLLS